MNTVTIAQINANEADDEDDMAKNNFAMRIQYVCELALSNKLKVNNIDCVMSLDQVPDRSYDLVLMDLIEPSGKLSQDNIEKVPILRNKLRLTTSDSILLPMNLTVHCMLIQSDKLRNMSFVDDQNVHGFKLASIMNQFSVNHLQDLDLHSLLSSGKCEDAESGKFLSEPLDVFKFDLMALSSTDAVRKDFEIGINDNGAVNGIAYWFTQDCGWGVSVSNFHPPTTQNSQNFSQNGSSKNHSLLKQACITFPSPILVAKDEKFKFTFLYSNGLIDFVYLKE